MLSRSLWDSSDNHGVWYEFEIRNFWQRVVRGTGFGRVFQGAGKRG